MSEVPRRVVVAGVAGDVGGAVARAFAAQGWRVCGWARREPEGLEGLELEDFRKLDLADGSGVEAAASATWDERGAVDCVVNCAGRYDRLDEVVRAEQVFADNLGVAESLFAAFVPKMLARDAGRFLTISSIDGVHVNPNSFGYSAAKAAVNTVSNLYRRKYRDTRLNFDLICPGGINTRIRATREEDKAALLQPADLAALCVFLAGLGWNVSFEDILIHPKRYAYVR